MPLIRHVGARTALGLALLLCAVAAVGSALHAERTWEAFAVPVGVWLVATLLTDKYRHKYPQRYLTYLLASHLKAAVVMAILLGLATLLAGPATLPRDLLWMSFGIFAMADALLALPSRREDLEPLPLAPPAQDPKGGASPGEGRAHIPTVNTRAILERLPADLDPPLAAFIRERLPVSEGTSDGLIVLEDIPAGDAARRAGPAGLLVGTLRVNDVRRLDLFLQHCASSLEMGGFLAIRYIPLENAAIQLRKRHPGWTYRPAYLATFLWYRAIPKIPFLDRVYFWPGISWFDDAYYAVARKRNRALSKAEVWGRLAYHGMQVVAESKGDGELVVLAQKQGPPVRQRMPSYYPVVGLEKIGLDGIPMRTHKVRSMYPFSEFLQKRIFEDHGLAATGKFQNDFRLTEYGKFIRKYWLDELPQLYDWLHGDIKLVGMRATSRHFLGLYPKELYDLYVQVKPGLVPPIFSETTGGFDQIVDVEMTYLRSYWERPLFTDAQYLWQTFSDIVFRGVRSK